MSVEEKFEFVWEHLRRNPRYRRGHNQPAPADKDCSLIKSPLPLPVNPALDWKSALAEVRSFDQNYFAGPQWAMAAATVAEAVLEAPVVWNEYGAKNAAWRAGQGKDVPWFFQSRQRAMKLAEQSGDKEAEAERRDELRQFFENDPQVDFKIDSSAPTETVLAAFKREWARLQRVRRGVGAKQRRKQQAPKGDWRKQLDIYDAVMEHAQFVKGQPVFGAKTLKQIIPKRFAKLPQQKPVSRADRNALALVTRQIKAQRLAGTPRERCAAALDTQQRLQRKIAASEKAQARYEKAKTKLRRRIEDAFRASRERVEAMLPA